MIPLPFRFYLTTTWVVVRATKVRLRSLRDSAILRPWAASKAQNSLPSSMTISRFRVRCKIWSNRKDFHALLRLCRTILDSGAQRNAACLIADIRMPGMSGLELQAKLKADRCRIPIIFITAHGDAKMQTQALREGAFEILGEAVRQHSFTRGTSCSYRRLVREVRESNR